MEFSPVHHVILHSWKHSLGRQQLLQQGPNRFRLHIVSCTVASSPLQQITRTEPKPVLCLSKAFAPATVANLGPGYDFLGCAVDGLGDYVTAEIDSSVKPGEVCIREISGDNGKLSRDSQKNCAGIAAKSTMELLGIKSLGISIQLSKGLPLGSGLGSSAASAAAAAVAVNALFGSPLTKMELVQAGLESEKAVSGYHADNVAPSLLGGFILIRSYEPLDIIPLAFPEDKELFFVLSTPLFEAPTKEMRKVVPKLVEIGTHVANCSQAAALVTGILSGDVQLLGEALAADSIVEPARSPLIPGMGAVKVNAMECGAFGCTISGAGPTAVAVTDKRDKAGRIGEGMVRGFWENGQLNAEYSVHRLDSYGARVIDKPNMEGFDSWHPQTDADKGIDILR